jgi:hypothetical protein
MEMATLEHEQRIRCEPPRPREHHVFVSVDGRRQRALRTAGLVAGGLALVWLVALGLALAGSTRLPGLPVPDGKPVPARDVSAGSSTALEHSRPIAQATRAPTAMPLRHELPRAASPTSTARATAPARAIEPVPRVAPVAVTMPTTQTASTPTQGSVRRGWTAPPGQTKRDEPTPRGTGRPTDAGLTSTTHGNGHGKG